MKENIECWDVECYTNLFSLASINYETKNRTLFVISEVRNDILGIMEFFKQKKTLFVGHNILNYDNILISYIIKNYSELKKLNNLEICKKLKFISDKIIEKKRNEKWSDLLKVYLTPSYKCLDTYQLMNTIDRISLKQASVNLKYHNVQDLPYSPETILTQEQIIEVLAYNFNDCEIQCLLYEHFIPNIELRKEVSKIYKLDVSNANDTAIAKKIINKNYSEKTGISENDFKDLRSFNSPFYLKEVVPTLEFETKEFQDLYNWFKNQLITEKTEISTGDTEKKEKISYDLIHPVINIRFALGGCHSMDLPGMFVSDNNTSIRDFDFNSFYPYIIIRNKAKARHVRDEFIDILADITEERIKAKKEKRKKDAEILKIVINSTYGLYGSNFYWLKDTKALLKVTVTGQLYLAKLTEMLLLAEIKVLSVNTDGVLSEVKQEQNAIYEEICNQCSKMFDIEGEFTNYTKYIRKDVNNYLSIDTKGEIKTKGKYFTTKVQLSKGYYYPIIAKALVDYFVNNIPVETTIKNENDVYLFMCSQKIDTNKFNPEIQYFSDNQIVTEQIQKINRWIITKTGAKFAKVEKVESKINRLQKKELNNKRITDKDSATKKIGIEKDYLITVLNKVENTNAKDYNINYSFYINLCNEVIDDISPRVQQLSMF